jgi:F0F1-type ATP synthase assembly protein I
MPKQEQSAWVQAARYSGLAMIVPAGAFTGFVIGYLLDRHFRTGHIFEAVLVIAGIVGGMIELIRAALREQ